MDTEELARYLLIASQIVEDFSIPTKDLTELAEVFTDTFNEFSLIKYDE